MRTSCGLTRMRFWRSSRWNYCRLLWLLIRSSFCHRIRIVGIWIRRISRSVEFARSPLDWCLWRIWNNLICCRHSYWKGECSALLIRSLKVLTWLTVIISWGLHRSLSARRSISRHRRLITLSMCRRCRIVLVMLLLVRL